MSIHHIALQLKMGPNVLNVLFLMFLLLDCMYIYEIFIIIIKCCENPICVKCLDCYLKERLAEETIHCPLCELNIDERQIEVFFFFNYLIIHLRMSSLMLLLIRIDFY